MKNTGLFLLGLCLTSATQRCVVTFDGLEPSAIDRWHSAENGTVNGLGVTPVKWYGLRLVLQVSQGITVTTPEIMDYLSGHGVLYVEEDRLVGQANLWVDGMTWNTPQYSALWNGTSNFEYATQSALPNPFPVASNISNPFNLTGWDGVELRQRWLEHGRGSGHVVAVIDSGLAASALQLIGNILPG
jgi:hypothetical protein